MLMASKGAGPGAPPERTVEILCSPEASDDGTGLVLSAPHGADHVRVDVYDVRGRLVARLLDEDRIDPGESRIAWNRRDSSGRPVGSGVYFVRLRTSRASATGKLVVVR